MSIWGTSVTVLCHKISEQGVTVLWHKISMSVTVLLFSHALAGSSEPFISVTGTELAEIVQRSCKVCRNGDQAGPIVHEEPF